MVPAQHPPGRQVVQLDGVAGAAQHPARGYRVEREGHRGPRVVDGQQATAGLVVDHDEFALGRPGPGHRRAVAWLTGVLGPGVPGGPVVQAVDPAGDRDQVGLGRDGPFHPGRLAVGIEPGHVVLDHRPGAAQVLRALGVIGIPVGEPAAREQRAGRLGRPFLPVQPPPPGQRVVHAGAQAVVRPRRALRWRRPVQVRHPVPSRAIQPGPQPARRARVQPPRHSLEAKLFHATIVAHGTDNPARITVTPARRAPIGQLLLVRDAGGRRAQRADSASFQNAVSIPAVVSGASTAGEWAAPGMQMRSAPSRFAIMSWTSGGQASSFSP